MDIFGSRQRQVFSLGVSKHMQNKVKFVKILTQLAVEVAKRTS